MFVKTEVLIDTMINFLMV